MLSRATDRLDDRAEALLMAADRAQHVSEVVEPALRAGRHVVCDRYIGSSVAYQGYGRGLDPDMVRAVSGWAAGGLWPDLTVLLSVPDEVAAARTGGARDRIEDAGDDFHRRVLDGFRDQLLDEPEYWVEVDGSGSPDEVEELVLDALADALPDLDAGG
jgi:dTMP kinase